MLPDCIDHPLFIGEFARFELGINQVPVDGELETASSGWD
jgi:hypothetical protein